MAYSQSTQLFVDNWGDTTEQYVYRADGGLDYKVEYFGSYRKVTGYHMNGVVSAIGYYRKDRKNGTWKFYDLMGEMIAEVKYKDGQRISAIEYRYFIASN
jgi:antitoxin component YwqK of YwqJK toxin-antitoxin module